MTGSDVRVVTAVLEAECVALGLQLAGRAGVVDTPLPRDGGVEGGAAADERRLFAWKKCLPLIKKQNVLINDLE